MDVWLLKRFPGRTLDELDRMDWLRYQRALEAEDILEAEEIRLQMIEGSLPGDKISPSIWEKIRTHDEWLSEADNG